MEKEEKKKKNKKVYLRKKKVLCLVVEGYAILCWAEQRKDRQALISCMVNGKEEICWLIGWLGS